MIRIILFVLLSHTTEARELTESEIYHRCYSQMVREAIPINDPILQKVKQGKTSAWQACLSLLNEVDLDLNFKDPSEERIIAASRPSKILRTFQSFHDSWFTKKDFIRDAIEAPTANLFDSNEMGYHISVALFGKSQKYSEIVLRKSTFRGVRYIESKPEHLFGADATGKHWKINEKDWQIGLDKKTATNWSPPFVEFGELYGIRPVSKGKNNISFVDMNNNKLLVDKNLTGTGAGVLGSPSFLLLNHTFMHFEASDNARLMYRLWAKAFFSDLFCRSLPLLREEDAKPFVFPNSTVEFRKRATCMQCHASTDNLGATIRNLVEIRPGGTRDDIFEPRLMAEYNPDKPAKKDDGEIDVDFFRRPPDGLLYFRNYRGQLIKKKIKGVGDAGKAIASTTDLYICAAKRYFKFFTGIDVKVDDFSLPFNSELDPESLKYRELVVQLGEHLQEHQSLKKLISEIIKSKVYSSSNYEVKK